MDEIKETGKWYVDVPYQECKDFINTRLQSMTRDFIAIGYYLKYVRDHELYLEDGYKDVFEFADKEYSMKRPTVNHCIKVNTEFSLDGNSPVPDEKYKDFSRSQLQELLYVSEEDRNIVTPTMTIKEIRKIHTKKLDVESEPEKKSFEECAAYKCNGCCDNCHHEDKDNCLYDRTGYKVADWRIEHDRRTQEEYDRIRAEEEKLSAYGTEKMVRPEDSLLDTEGCEGGHDCFSCSMDCGIRQKDRYCMEAPLGKPFPCATMNVLDGLRQDVGDKCQFINYDLAYHRSGDHEPDPCCKECKEPCGYACPRAARKVTKSVVPAQEESESIDALEFSARVYNVLKKAGIDTVGQLLHTPDSELVKIRNLSKRCLDEIHSKLDAYRSDIESPQEESDPERVSGEVIGFEDDGSVQKWQELLPDIPLFTESTIKDFLCDEEKDLREYLEVDGLPFKVISRKQMTVAGLRLLLELISGGDGNE